MVKTLGMLAALSVLCAAPVPDEKPSDAKTILNDAIKALGGRDKLVKLPATTFNSQGYLLVGEYRVESKSTWSVQYPDKYRYDAKIKVFVADDWSGLMAIGNGKDGWNKQENQQTNDIAPHELKMLQQHTRAVHLAHRLVPLTEKGYELSPLGELKIDNRPAVGIKVVEKGQPDLDLFFDKETHLPVKAAFRCNESQDAVPVMHAFFFNDYKEADGVKHFTKIRLFRDDKQILEMNLSNVKRREKVDASLFEKP